MRQFNTTVAVGQILLVHRLASVSLTTIGLHFSENSNLILGMKWL